MNKIIKNKPVLPTISQCMIVKNEEKNIERALSWSKGIVCEQIVVDTGSTDRTVELAEKMGAKIFHFEWINDFAAAKNFAISKAKGDWIAFLDADEYIIKEEAVKLPKVLFALGSQKEMVDGIARNVNVIAMDLINIQRDGAIISSFKQHRFFRNMKDIRFSGAIHEHLDGTINQPLVPATLKGMIRIIHTGYGDNLSADEMKQKSIRNISMIRNELAKKPSSALYKMYMAESLILDNNLEDALIYIKQAVLNEDNSLSVYSLIHSYQNLLYWLVDKYTIHDDSFNDNDWAEINEYYKLATELNSTYPDFDIAMGIYMYRKNKASECIACLEMAISKAQQADVMEHSKFLILLKDIYHMLSKSYLCLNDMNNSLRYDTLLREINS